MTRDVFDTVEELLTHLAQGRDWRVEPMAKHVDSLSGSAFEYAQIGAERFIIKHISRDLDWLMRVLDDGAAGAAPRALTMWREGLLDRRPADIDTTIAAMAYDPATGHLWQVMHDVASTLVPADGPVALDQHRRFLRHMAGLHARFLGFQDRYGLTTPAQRYGFARPDHSAREAAAGHDDPVPRAFPGGWAALRAAAPEAAGLALDLVSDARPLASAMADGPQTLVHGDWKFGNLGSHPDGRTVLLDWGWPGQANPCVDLAWYLAVNCDRLPEPKEDAIAAYRDELEAARVATGPWWDRQLELALLGGFLQLAWSKSGAELAWWLARVTPTARSLRGATQTRQQGEPKAAG